MRATTTMLPTFDLRKESMALSALTEVNSDVSSSESGPTTKFATPYQELIDRRLA